MKSISEPWDDETSLFGFFPIFFNYMEKSRDSALSDGDIVTFPMRFYVKVTFYIFL